MAASHLMNYPKELTKRPLLVVCRPNWASVSLRTLSLQCSISLKSARTMCWWQRSPRWTNPKVYGPSQCGKFMSTRSSIPWNGNASRCFDASAIAAMISNGLGDKICVGVVASLSERGPKTVEVYATYQATIPSKSGSIDEYKLFHVPLLNGIWSASLLSKILNGLTWWSFHCNEDLTPDHTALSRNSIRIGDHVYKTFNYTGRTIAKEHQRQSQHTLNHLGNEYSPEKVLSSDAMEVIRYKFIDGSHAPTHSNQVLSLLMKFQTLWNQNLVFADFRLSNVVFLSDQKGGVLIDYDMMRVHGEGQYLPGFCEEVPDGVRHPDAYEYATTRTEHDQYALSHTLLKLVKPKNPDHQADWEAACTFIRDDVALAVQLLTERCFEIELIDASVLPSEGTGTRAREARKKRRADSGLPEVPNSKRMTTSFPAEESPSAT
jgi:hypothetical protein